MNTLPESPQTSNGTLVISVLLLSSLFVLSGCVAGIDGPSDQSGPVGLNVTNAANVTHTFEVFVVDLPANLTIKNVDKGTYTTDIGQAGLSTTKLNSHNNTVTEVKPPNTARLHGRYTLKTSETNRSNVSSFRDDSAVVVVISHNGTVASLVTSQCDGDLVYLRVTMRHYGSNSAYDCDEGAF